MVGMKHRARPVVWVIVAVLALAPLLAGCDPTATISAQPETRSGRRFTIPAAYFGDQSEEAIEAGLAKIGAFDLSRDADGSYTVTMNDADYDQFIEDDLAATKEVIESVCGGPGFESLSRVTMDDDLNNITYTSRVDDPGDQGERAAEIAIYYACLYQTLAGQPLVCTVRLNGPAGKLIDQWSYPELGTEPVL